MSRTFTLSELRTRVRERADMENSNFVSDNELDRYISASYTELYDMLVKADPERFLEEQSFTLTSASTTTVLPSDYYGTLNVLVEVETGHYEPVHKIVAGELANWPRENTSLSYRSSNSCPPYFGYRFRQTIYEDNAGEEEQPYYDNLLEIFPRVTESTDFVHVYIRAPQIRDKDNGRINGISGWEEYIVLDAAIKCLQKEESNTAHLERALERMRQRIEVMAENRAAAEAGHVADTGHYTGLGRWRRWYGW